MNPESVVLLLEANEKFTSELEAIVGDKLEENLKTHLLMTETALTEFYSDVRMLSPEMQKQVNAKFKEALVEQIKILKTLEKAAEKAKEGGKVSPSDLKKKAEVFKALREEAEEIDKAIKENDKTLFLRFVKLILKGFLEVSKFLCLVVGVSPVILVGVFTSLTAVFSGASAFSGMGMIFGVFGGIAAITGIMWLGSNLIIKNIDKDIESREANEIANNYIGKAASVIEKVKIAVAKSEEIKK